MKDFIYKKFIIYLILLEPVLDIITSFMVMNNIPLSLGIVVKLFIMLLACIYLLFIDKENVKVNIICLSLLFALCFFNITNNMDIIKIHLFSYFGYLIKYTYSLVMLLFFIRWCKKYEFKLYQLRIPLTIIVVTYFISLFTNTAFVSYKMNANQLGFSGWYSSANELGNLLCLLFPISLYNAFYNKDGILMDKLLFFGCGLIMILLGTKVGLFGFYCILLAYLLTRLIMIIRLKLDKIFFMILSLVLITTCLYKNLPAYRNMKYSYKYYENVPGVVLSGRDNFVTEAKKKRKNIDFYNKLVGRLNLSNKNGSILIVEQDFKDIYFMYGIVGLTFIIILYIYIYYFLITKVLSGLKKNNKFSKKYFALFISVSILLCVAYISGHAILSPSVSIYLSLFMALATSIDVNLKRSQRKKILVSSHSSFINKIDNSKYEVICFTTGNVIKNDNFALYPYYNNKKIFSKKIFKNKFMYFNLIRNENFDYILGDNNNSIMDNYFLRHSHGKKIVVGKKKDKYFNESISIKNINSL